MTKKRIANFNAQSGFTLVESLVVIGVTTILIGTLIFSSRGGQTQIAFLKEEATIVGALLQARSFAIDAFQPTLQPTPGSPADPLIPITERVCAWGVHVDPVEEQYILFRDLDPAGPSSNCSGADRIYTVGEEFEVFKADTSLNISCAGIIPGSCAQGNIVNVLFTPPVPKVSFTPDPGGTGSAFLVRLETKDGTRVSDITVTKGGSVHVN